MKTQMELGLNGNRNHTPSRRRRMPVARWWFQRMHSVVDQAFDWTTPPARPQQAYLTLLSKTPGAE